MANNILSKDAEDAASIVVDAIDALKESVDPKELSYLAISGGVEGYMRDKLAFLIYKTSRDAGGTCQLFGLAEKQRLDLLVVEKDESKKGACDVDVKFIVELKTRLPNELHKDKGHKDSVLTKIKNDMLSASDKLPKYLSGNGKVWDIRLHHNAVKDKRIPALWLFIFPYPSPTKDGYDAGSDIELLITKNYRPEYRRVSKEGEKWHDQTLSQAIEASVESIAKCGQYTLYGSGELGSSAVLGVNIQFDYFLFSLDKGISLT